MVVLTCNRCESTKLTRYEGKMTDNGHCWFSCKSCGNNFPLKNSSYREEADIFE